MGALGEFVAIALLGAIGVVLTNSNRFQGSRVRGYLRWNLRVVAFGAVIIGSMGAIGLVLALLLRK